MTHYSIRKMTEDELSLAIDWGKNEGWNPGLDDAHCFYQADPNGFFVGCLDDEPIAVGSAVIYSEQFAFCGLYIVKPKFRKQGYGLQLTEERLRYVGNRITGIDGVLENISKYEKIGYVSAYKQTRYKWSGQAFFTVSSKNIVDGTTIPFQQLEAFDRNYFPAPRSSFLRGWIHQRNGHAMAYVENHELKGYGVIRKCFEGYKIGPLFAENSVIADSLFKTLVNHAEEGPVYIDVPAPNKNALNLVHDYDMTPTFEVIRMYRNGTPREDNLENIFGVTTFELG